MLLKKSFLKTSLSLLATPLFLLGSQTASAAPCISGAINFNDTLLKSYDFPGGDVSSSFSVIEEGCTVYLDGNTWASTDSIFNVTEDMILEFSYISNRQGEIHAIGFEPFNNPSGQGLFAIHGTQSDFGITDYRYNIEGDYEQFRIPVGKYITGTNLRLVLTMDQDTIFGESGNGYFDNIRLYVNPDLVDPAPTITPAPTTPPPTATPALPTPTPTTPPALPTPTPTTTPALPTPTPTITPATPTPTPTITPATPTPTPAPVSPVVNIIETEEFGRIMVAGTDAAQPGFSVYTFDNDVPGQSNCFDDCLVAWPAVTVESDEELVAPEGLEGALGTIIRSDDGSMQVTFNDMPLYYYIADSAPGDTEGQAVGDVWWLVELDQSSPVLDIVSTDDFGRILVAGEDAAQPGFSVYTFDNDVPGETNCFEDCLVAWPAVTVESADDVLAPEGLSGTLGTITRPDDGTIQVTYNNMPLYYYIADQAAGDTLGQAVGDVWWLVQLDSSDMSVYEMTFTSHWDEHGALPNNAHFSSFVGATHSDEISFFALGEFVSPGVEDVAELGQTTAFAREIESDIEQGTVKEFLQGSDLFISRENSITIENITVDRSHPYVSIISMIAPSPDWFIAVSNESLLNEQGEWRKTVSIDVYPYDAGTEEGENYSLNNPATDPQDAISSLRGMAPFTNEKIGTFTFEQIN